MLKVTSNGKEKQLLEKSDILDIFYPVGSVFMLNCPVMPKPNYPQEHFGGVWLPIEEKFLYCEKQTNTSGNVRGNAKAKITLKENQIPAHRHKEFLEIVDETAVGTIQGCTTVGTVKGQLKDSGITTGYACGTSSADGLTKGTEACQEVDIMPPSYTVFAWVRQA